MIRFWLGLFLVFCAVGGMDAQPFASSIVFASQLALAVVGLIIMHLGVKKMNRQ